MTPEEKRDMTPEQRRVYNAGFEARARMSNKSGCCCLFGEDDETVLKVCAAHLAWRDAAIAEAVQQERRACAGTAHKCGNAYRSVHSNSKAAACFEVAIAIEAREDS